MFSKRKLKIKSPAFGIFALSLLLISALLANDLKIRDESGSSAFVLSGDGTIRGSMKIETNAATTPVDSADLIMRTYDAAQNQMIFKPFIVKLKGTKIKYIGIDDDIANGLYFINTEAETNKQVQAAVTEIAADLVHRGNIENVKFPLCSLKVDPLNPGRTNHPVLFVHGINSSAERTFDVRSLSFSYNGGGSCSTWVQDSSGLKWQIIYGVVKTKFSFNVKSSCGETFPHESIVRLASFNYHAELKPEDVTMEAAYNENSDKITYVLYNNNTEFMRGEVRYRMLDTLEALADKPQERTRAYVAFSDKVVGYGEKSIPAYLAKTLGLNTEFDVDNPSAGINSNGLYFFNAKRPAMKDTILLNVDATPVFLSGNAIETHIVRDPYPSYAGTARIRLYFELIVTGMLPIRVTRTIFGKKEWSYNQPDDTWMVPYNIVFSPGKDTIYYSVQTHHNGIWHDTVCIDSIYEELSYFDTLPINKVGYWIPDGLVHPDWNADTLKYGQANQLADRMVEVLDDFYGKDAWKTKHDAVLDIVCHSQGGQVTRIAIFHKNLGADSASLENPVNHINRVVTMGTPHWGSAFATDTALLKIGNPDNLGTPYTHLATLRERLIGEVSAGVLADLKGTQLRLPAVVTALTGFTRAAIKDLVVKGSYLGPYNFKGKVLLWSYVPWPVAAFPFSITSDFAKDARNGLQEFGRKSAHLAWRDESPFTNKLVNLVTYPTRPYYDNDRIYVTHLYSGAATYFMTRTFDDINSVVKEYFRKCWLPIFLFAPNVTSFVTTVYRQLQDDLDSMRTVLHQLDGEWSNDGDVVVEAFSQKGVNDGAGFDTLNNPLFKTKKFSQYDNRITHINLSKLNPRYSWECAQSYDVSQELGVSLNPDGDKYMANGTLAQSALQPHTSGDKIAISFVNNSDDILRGFTAEYYVTADSALQPSLNVINNGGLSITMSKCIGNLYKILFDASSVTLNPMVVLPFSGPAEFQVYYNVSGRNWNHKDDYSFIAPDSGDSLHPEYSDSLLDNVKIVVRDTSGTVISGIEPDSAAIKKMALSYCSVYSMERADWDRPGGNTVTQPTLTLVNTGSNVVENAHLYYFFATSGQPVVTADLPAQTTVYLDTMGREDTLNRYAVHIACRGIELHPEDYISGINFEIRNSNGSLWNYKADPSFLCSNTSLCDDTLVYNANILILDEEGNRLGGVHPADFSSDTGSMTEIALEATDSSSDYVSRPKVRIINTGDDTLQSFRIYYYFEVERGSHISLSVQNLPSGCTVNWEQLIGSKYRLVYNCINANVAPNDTFPGVAGITVELRQYNIIGNNNFWDRNNDYSSQGLDAVWKESQNIVVKDLEGNILWGIEP